MRLRGILLGLAAALVASGAQAALVVSSQATKHVQCAHGKCVARGADAVLNIDELEGLLAAGDVKLVAGARAKDLEIEAPLSWTSAHKLALAADRSIVVDAPVTDAGLAMLALWTGQGGAGGGLAFGSNGQIRFLSTTNPLWIDGSRYTLVSDVASLAIAVAAKPDGLYALAADVDLRRQTYHGSAVVTSLFGRFEGLGNTIANFKMRLTTGTEFNDYQGLFAIVEIGGAIENLRLKDVDISAVNSPYAETLGALVGLNAGTLTGNTVSGLIRGVDNTFLADRVGGLAGESWKAIALSHTNVTMKGCSLCGGLAGLNSGSIIDSSASGRVSSFGGAGGLVGSNEGHIARSFATGAVDDVKVRGGFTGYLGGLASSNSGQIVDSYATGGIRGFNMPRMGSLLGHSEGTVSSSFGIGLLTGSVGNMGGLVGENVDAAYTADYWDMDSTGFHDTRHGVGNQYDVPGITGLSDAQLKSALPAGFDPNVWAQSADVNGGYPYLKSNPPQ